MSDMWVNIGRVWDHHKPPMRPHPDTVENLRRELATDDADVLLLGVTPELARMGKTLVAVDAGAPMIAALWIGDESTRRAILGNWLSLPLPDSSVDAVVGDGCLSAVTTESDRLQLLSEAARVLRPGGRVGIRLFARPEEPESFEDIEADVAAADVPSLSALMLRVALARPATGPDYAHKLSEILRQDRRVRPQPCGTHCEAWLAPRRVLLPGSFRGVIDGLLLAPGARLRGGGFALF